jgi:hypothetical protein
MPPLTAPAETERLKAPVIPAGLESADIDQALARPEELLEQLQSQVGNQALTSAVQRSPEDGRDGGVVLDERLPSPDEVASELPAGGVLDDAATETATATGGGPGGDWTDGGPVDGGLPGGVETPPDLLTGDAGVAEAGADRPPEGELRSGGADVERALDGGAPPTDGLLQSGGPGDAAARGGPTPPDGRPPADTGRVTDTPNADRTGQPQATDRADGGATPTDAPAADDAAAGSGGMDGALVETELAEHERWGAAVATVGGVQSADRAGFIAEQVGEGMGDGFQSGAVAGLLMGFGSKAVTRAIGSRVPIPVIGSIIGGVIGAAGLVSAVGTAEGRAQIGDKLGAIGQGEGYEWAANIIDGLITVLDLAANILDSVGLVCGAIAAVAWLGVIPSFGATSPIAATCTAIATAVGAAATVLSLVKMGLTPLVLLLRALHTFTSEADPREVQAQGAALSDTGKALGGTLGGLAGSKTGEATAGAAADRLGMPETPGARYVDDPEGRPAGGDGPSVEAVPGDDPRTSIDRAVEGIDRPETGWGEPLDPADPRNPLRGASDQEIDAGLSGLGEDPRTSIDRAMEGIDRPETGWGEPLDPADSRNPLRGASDAEIDAALREPGMSDVDQAMQSLDRPETGWGEPFDPNDRRNPLRGASDADIDMGAGITPVPEPVPSVIVDPSIEGVETIPAPARPVDNRPQTDVDWYDPITNPTGTVHLDDVRAMTNNPQGSNWHPDDLGQPLDPAGYRGELGQMKTVMDPATGMPMLDAAGNPIREFAPEGRFNPMPEGGAAVRSGRPGGWADAVYPPGQQGFDDATAAATAAAADGSAAIRDRSALPVEWPGGHPGNPVDDMNVFPVTNPRNDPAVSPGQPHSNFQVPTIESVVAPQPEGAPGPGRRDFYPGGGPQTQVPGWHSPVPGDRDASRPFMTDRAPTGDRLPLTGPGGRPMPSLPIDRTVLNPLPPDAAVRRAEDWGTRTNAKKVPLTGLTAGRWDAGMDAAQAGDLAKKAIKGEGTPYRPGFAADDNPFADVAEERREKADANVERVNPNYERPPGTPAQLADMRAEIAHMRAAERLARADVATAEAHQAETAKRAGQIEQVTGTVEGAKEATKAQQGDVAETAEANAGQQERQEQAGTDLGTSASRLAGLGTLEALLSGWATGASAVAGVFYLIGSVIDSANSAGDKCGASAADALTFMEKLTEARMIVGGEAAKSPMEMGRLSNEKAALDTEKERAEATEGDLLTARTGVDSAAEQNASDAANAAECRADGSTDAAEAAAAAEDRQAQHDQLEVDLQAWAERHAQQRAEAVQGTVDRLIKKGYLIEAVNSF